MILREFSYSLFPEIISSRNRLDSSLSWKSSLRACLYEMGWPVSELARLRVRYRFSGHSFVNISLRLYACWAGPPCRDPGSRLPGFRLKRANFSLINRRNGPARLRRTCDITFGAKGPACPHPFFCKIERTRKYFLNIWILPKRMTERGCH